MENALIGVVALVFLAAGLGVGLYLRRTGITAAASAARQEPERQVAILTEQLRSRDEALAEAKRLGSESSAALEAEHERVLALASESARAQGEAAQVPELKAALEDTISGLKLAREEATRASVKSAEGTARVGELEPQVIELKGKLEAQQKDLDDSRNAAAAISGRLAKALADIEGVEKRRVDTAAAFETARDARTKLQADLDDLRNQASTFQSELATAKADLAASEQRAAKATEELRVLRERAESLQAELRQLTADRARLTTDLDAERRSAEERKTEAEKNREQVRAEVEKLAARLLEQQGKTMLERSRDGIEALLKPLGEKLREFEQKVEKTYDTDNRERASLREQLKALQDAQARLHKDAEALSKALTRDSKQQGDWGEIVLERVLEAAGLSKGREYDLQVSHTDDDGGRKRPDALVYLPENRAVVVDAKCSLTAFVDAARSTSDEEKENALEAHLVSMRAHVKSLAGKSYTEVLQQRSLDFVMMFVPSEAAFLAALSRDPGLYENAFRHNVVLCSPTTLIAALRLIAQLWRTENQNQNARRIAEEAGKLLEKLAAFVTDLDSVGERLSKAQDAFVDARAKLSTGKGNVLRRAATIVSLGAPVKTDRARALLTDGTFDDGHDGDPGELGDAVPVRQPATVRDEVS